MSSQSHLFQEFEKLTFKELRSSRRLVEFINSKLDLVRHISFPDHAIQQEATLFARALTSRNYRSGHSRTSPSRWTTCWIPTTPELKTENRTSIPAALPPTRFSCSARRCGFIRKFRRFNNGRLNSWGHVSRRRR